MFSKLLEKIRNFFSPNHSTVGSVVPEKKPKNIVLGKTPGSNIPPAMARFPRPSPPPAPPVRTQPRRVDTAVRQSAVPSGDTKHQTSGIDPLTAGLVGYMIGSSGNNTVPAASAQEREYVYMGDGMMEEVINKPTPVVCEPAPVFDSPTPSSYESPSHSSSYDSSYSSSDSYSSSSSDYSSSSYDSGSYDSGSSSFD